jgi:predicted DNA-binding transcriptional regulator YafY
MAEEVFTPREGFDLATLTKDCFGIWREKAMDVALRFDQGAVEEALAWHFHASQILEQQPDGTLLVRFRACGMEEIAEHVAHWGARVTVLAPEALRVRVCEMGQVLANHHVGAD